MLLGFWVLEVLTGHWAPRRSLNSPSFGLPVAFVTSSLVAAHSQANVKRKCNLPHDASFAFGAVPFVFIQFFHISFGIVDNKRLLSDNLGAVYFTIAFEIDL